MNSCYNMSCSCEAQLKNYIPSQTNNKKCWLESATIQFYGFCFVCFFIFEAFYLCDLVVITLKSFDLKMTDHFPQSSHRFDLMRWCFIFENKLKKYLFFFHIVLTPFSPIFMGDNFLFCCRLFLSNLFTFCYFVVTV